MKKIDLGQTVAILANVGVIAGIVFLAVEIQQNTESLNEARNFAIAEAQQAMRAQLDESFRSLANSDELPEIFVKYRQGGREALTEEELQRFIWQSCSGLNRLYTHHTWYERGYMDEPTYNEEFKEVVVQMAPRWRDIGISPRRPAFREAVQSALKEAGVSTDLSDDSRC